jgi:hypothetical protein
VRIAVGIRRPKPSTFSNNEALVAARFGSDIAATSATAMADAAEEGTVAIKTGSSVSGAVFQRRWDNAVLIQEHATICTACSFRGLIGSERVSELAFILPSSRISRREAELNSILPQYLSNSNTGTMTVLKWKVR